jgi:hypothetical protein
MIIQPANPVNEHKALQSRHLAFTPANPSMIIQHTKTVNEHKVRQFLQWSFSPSMQ